VCLNLYVRLDFMLLGVIYLTPFITAVSEPIFVICFLKDSIEQ
jgi:hypothetical protein